MHRADPSHNGGKGANNRHKTSQYERFFPMLFIKILCFDQVFFLKQPWVFLLKYAATKSVTSRVANVVTQNCTYKRPKNENPNVKQPLRCYESSRKKLSYPLAGKNQLAIPIRQTQLPTRQNTPVIWSIVVNRNAYNRLLDNIVSVEQYGVNQKNILIKTVLT